MSEVISPPAPFAINVRVYYEDTDASGVVYHASYLRWFERARTEWLRHIGFEQHSLRDQLGVLFTVSNIKVDYRRPARLDQQLQVQTRVLEARRVSLTFEQTVRRPEDTEWLARAQVKVGCVDVQRFRPCALPKAFKDILKVSFI